MFSKLEITKKVKKDNFISELNPTQKRIPVNKLFLINLFKEVK